MSVALRIEEHSKGQTQMFEGDYYGALSTLQRALHAYGPHVGLLSDLIAVMYLLGRVQDVDSMLERLQIELVAAATEISPDSYSRTKIFIGKILEEQAKMERALLAYQDAAEMNGIEFDIKVRAQAQLLRLRAFLGIKPGLAELYHVCLKARTESKNLVIELEHALLLAEIVLFGTTLAKERIHTVLESPALTAADSRLFLIDFIEDVLRQGLNINDHQDLIHKIKTTEVDEFEKVIHLMALSPTFELSASDINKLSFEIPIMGLLRLLVLNIKRTTNEALKVESRRKFLFHLDTLTTESKALMLRKWGSDLSEIGRAHV